jgi:hypothetical protein
MADLNLEISQSVVKSGTWIIHAWLSSPIVNVTLVQLARHTL